MLFSKGSLSAAFGRLSKRYSDGLIDVDENARRVFAIKTIIACFTFAALFDAFVVFIMYGGWTRSHLLSVLCLFVLATSYFTISRFERPRLHWGALSVLLLAVTIDNAVFGKAGVYSSTTAFLVLYPLCSGYFLGRSGAVISWIIACGLLVGMYVVTLQQPPQVMLAIGVSHVHNLFSLSIFSTTVSMVLALMLNEGLQTALKRSEEISLRAIRSEEAKTKFFASLGHEIRTPLNGVFGLTDALKREGLSESQLELVDLIRESGESLLLSLNDLLDVSKLETGKLSLKLKPCRPEQVIEKLVANWHEAARRKGLVMTVEVGRDVPECVLMDDFRVRQVLVNLVSNAINFTYEGGVSVDVSAKDLDDGKSELVFRVMDTGRGIKAEKLDEIFEAYESGRDHVIRDFGGTGLGMPISKMLVELMGGEIGITSSDSNGTDIFVKLPVKKVPALLMEMDLHTENLQGVRVLAVDGNSINRKIIESYLKSWRVQVESAPSGKDCLKRLKNGDYDLVLMDKNAPGMNGMDVTRAIRVLEGEKGKVPVVGLAPAVTDDLRREFADCGMNGFVQKPIDPDTLKSAIVSALSRQH